ncbi:hypothetical protein SAMN04487957_110123 [Halomonas shengliensis]|uniref:Uncharacterized protein n=1 Tax=Halomonas shengliensis TaxID=419597 RepID=A0A1H0LVQ5_9GAMM|nr:hypothetical protein [Halomonas shengliensis]SDO72193.1 hypothetical protein SAMN04487957_110123 [Halomonas shengliensis]
MLDPKDPVDVWQLVFEQTPAVLRWVLGVLTMGIFTLAGVLYRWHRDDLKEVHVRMDRLEKRMEERHAETNRLLLQISNNTRGRS